MYVVIKLGGPSEASRGSAPTPPPPRCAPRPPPHSAPRRGIGYTSYGGLTMISPTTLSERKTLIEQNNNKKKMN